MTAEFVRGTWSYSAESNAQQGAFDLKSPVMTDKNGLSIEVRTEISGRFQCFENVFTLDGLFIDRLQYVKGDV